MIMMGERLKLSFERRITCFFETVTVTYHFRELEKCCFLQHFWFELNAVN